MSNFVKKNVIMDAEAMRRAIVRISHEIIERNKGVDNVVIDGVGFNPSLARPHVFPQENRNHKPSIIGLASVVPHFNAGWLSLAQVGLGHFSKV